MTLIVSALFSGLLYGLSFPPFNFHFLAWIALVPLLMTLRSDPQGCVYRGFLCGFVANLLIFSWIWKTFEAAAIAPAVIASTWVALAAVLALYFALFAWAYAHFPETFLRPWLLALFWAALELLRSVVLTGFPWALFAHTQAYNLPILQLASVTGALGISFLLVLSNEVIADLASPKKIAPRVQFVVVAAAIGGLAWWGHQRVLLIESELPTSASIKVAILQGNIDQYQKWDAVYEADIRSRYEGLLHEAVKSHPDVIVWPESALPGWYPNEAGCAHWIEKTVRESGTDNIVGAVTTRDKKDFNSVFHFDKTAKVAGVYDKQRLVPFGEFIPFGGALKKWIPYLGKLGTFDSGRGPTIFAINGARFAPNICYEAVFPGLITQAVRSGANIVVNVTNDGWFLDTGAPEQHYVTNIFRAVENGRPIVRAGNTGISAVIDPAGREILRSPLLVHGAYVENVPLKNFDTIYSLLYSRACHAN